MQVHALQRTVWPRAIVLALIMALAASGLRAEVTAFKQAVAEAASDDRELARFYRETAYSGLWTGDEPADSDRRKALFAAIAGARAHGFPAQRYDVQGLLDSLKAVRTARDLGFAEVALSKVFLRYATDLQRGMLDKARVLPANKRPTETPERLAHLERIRTANPVSYLRGLAPRTMEYARLMKEKARLEQLVADGGWGPTVPAQTLAPDDAGPAVLALRDRLIRMGYLGRSASATYDAALRGAVQRFQRAHGLEPDGVAGAATLAEINKRPAARLAALHVALERERWFNQARGVRHILVNITDFSARIIKDDAQVFATRSVVGKATPDRETPEFSDVMDHMVINPTWHVPRSIATKEYLPQMQRNRNAVGHLKLYDSRGRQVSRGAINFSRYTARTFPFSIKQPPSPQNALGLVKFMFPNKYNIYLHDTPQKHLFARETRAYSHGCVRLADPFDFAYALLADQADDPKARFHAILNTGRETKVPLENPIPVHIVYRTAFVTPAGTAQYRRDVYGRDAAIWDALQRTGVRLPDLGG